MDWYQKDQIKEELRTAVKDTGRAADLLAEKGDKPDQDQTAARLLVLQANAMLRGALALAEQIETPL